MSARTIKEALLQVDCIIRLPSIIGLIAWHEADKLGNLLGLKRSSVVLGLFCGITVLYSKRFQPYPCFYLIVIILAKQPIQYI